MANFTYVVTDPESGTKIEKDGTDAWLELSKYSDVSGNDLFGSYVYCTATLEQASVTSTAFRVISQPALIGDLVIDYETNTISAPLVDDGDAHFASADEYGNQMSNGGKLYILDMQENELEDVFPTYDADNNLLTATFTKPFGALEGFKISIGHPSYLGALRNSGGMVPIEEILPGEPSVVVTLSAGDGNGEIALTADYVQSIIASVQAANPDKKIVLVMRGSGSVELSADVMGSVAGGDALYVSTTAANLAVNKELLSELDNKNADVKLAAEAVALPDNTNAEAKAAIGERPVVDLSLTTGSTALTEFSKGGKVTVTLPYALGNGEDSSNIVVYYIKEDGTTEEITGVTYADGFVTFTTTHFSKFAVGYQAAETYTITFDANGGNAVSPITGIASGMAATLPTPTRSGSYRFDGWFTAASGGTQYTSSTPITGNVTLYAHWTYTGGGSSDSGGSPSSGGSTIVTPPVTPEQPNPPVTAETKAPPKVDADGNATVIVPESAVTDAIKAAQDAAKKSGTEKNGISILIDATTGKGASSITATLPEKSVEALIKAGITEVKIKSDAATISLDLNTLKQAQAVAGGSVTITAKPMKATVLSVAAQAAIGNRPVFELSMQSGGKLVSAFGGGSVSVALPYTLAAGEKAGNLCGVYVDDAGKVTYLTNSSYDANTKTLMFATGHFSTFGIGYKQDVPVFTDTTGHWAKDDIDFVVCRGLLSGTSQTSFAPDTGMTRGMFVTALGRLADMDSTKYKNTKFTDVVSEAYYAPYVAWAAEMGITGGTSATTFNPDKIITRQELATLMVNYAKAMKYTLPKTREVIAFADEAAISSFAKDAVKVIQMAGVMNGKNGNRFDPTGIATRAEVSATLRRYVELVIDIQTAQGLDVNDNGSAMMYENGKTVKSASRTVNGATYSFNANGEAALSENKKYRLHTVKANEYFWSISKLYGCTETELMALNNLKKGDVIHPGNTIKVPQK